MRWKISNEPSESYLTYPEIVEVNRSGQITDIQRSILWSNIRTSLASALMGLPLLGLGYFIIMLPAPRTAGGVGVFVILDLAILAAGCSQDDVAKVVAASRDRAPAQAPAGSRV